MIARIRGKPIAHDAQGLVVDVGGIGYRLLATPSAIRKADPKLVRNATGQVIGGVAPTGHPAPLRTVVDQTLASYPVIWTAAGTADSVMPLTYAQLLALTGGVALAVR